MSILEKNWLIRTRQNQILGPISKAKVLELLEKSSLLDDDELSSGNGYWFQVKEKDLMDKYIYGDLVQSFNPISEAENVLTLAPENKSQTSSIKPSTLPGQTDAKLSATDDQKESDILPDEEDLEYPDMDMGGNSQTENTMVVELPEEFSRSQNENLKSKETEALAAQETLVSTEDKDALLPEESDLEYPELDTNEEPIKETVQEMTTDDTPDIIAGPSKQKAQEEDSQNIHDEETKVPHKKKMVFTILASVLAVIGIIYGVFYYYTKILNKPFPLFGKKAYQNMTGLVLGKAMAQNEIKVLPKKKNMLI